MSFSISGSYPNYVVTVSGTFSFTRYTCDGMRFVIGVSATFQVISNTYETEMLDSCPKPMIDLNTGTLIIDESVTRNGDLCVYNNRILRFYGKPTDNGSINTVCIYGHGGKLYQHGGIETCRMIFLDGERLHSTSDDCEIIQGVWHVLSLTTTSINPNVIEVAPASELMLVKLEWPEEDRR
jgi:hypothetical protein